MLTQFAADAKDHYEWNCQNSSKNYVSFFQLIDWLMSWFIKEGHFGIGTDKGKAYVSKFDGIQSCFMDFIGKKASYFLGEIIQKKSLGFSLCTLSKTKSMKVWLLMKLEYSLEWQGEISMNSK